MSPVPAAPAPVIPVIPRVLGLASDHGGFPLKVLMAARLTLAGHTVIDFGNLKLEPGDDFPDYVVPLARAVAAGELERGIAICASGVGASIAANKVPGARACLVQDSFTARQGVEDDDLNVLCLGGLVTGEALAWDLVQRFLAADYLDEERFRRRLAKVAALEGPHP